METSIKEVLQDLNAGKYPKPAYWRDNRDVGADWPRHNPMEGVEPECWHDNVLETI